MPPTNVSNTTYNMKIIQEQIFGPILPVVEYDEINEATHLINSKDRPLGLYYFGTDKSEEDDLFNKTSSGGVTVNNVISLIQQNDLSFGGVGPSGMGRYKSFDGFKNFSNPRAYYKEVGFKLDKFFDAVRPPYKGSIEKVLKQLMKQASVLNFFQIRLQIPEINKRRYLFLYNHSCNIRLNYRCIKSYCCYICNEWISKRT